VDVLKKFITLELNPLPESISDKLVLHPPGGGLMFHDREEKLITMWGESYHYQEEVHNAAKVLLTKAREFEGYKINVDLDKHMEP
jgi:hypothetical protein